MISVAMAVHNGERFLAEQLASLREQTRPPGELVVCEDASSDRSRLILESFAQTSSFPVRILTNDQNCGSTASFERAIGLCQGRWIAPCDQDDVWRPSKLARLAETLDANPQASFAFSDAEIIQDDLKPYEHGLWDSVGFHVQDQKDFGIACLLRRNFVTGATMMFEARHRDRLLPIPASWIHDAWLALILTTFSTGLPIEEPLIRYRQHSDQQIGARTRSLREEYRAAASVTAETFELLFQQFEQARKRVEAWPDLRPGALSLLDRKLEHVNHRRRIRQPGVWRFPRVLGELPGYFRFSRGWASVIQDMLLP